MPKVFLTRLVAARLVVARLLVRESPPKGITSVALGQNLIDSILAAATRCWRGLFVRSHGHDAIERPLYWLAMDA